MAVFNYDFDIVYFTERREKRRASGRLFSGQGKERSGAYNTIARKKNFKISLAYLRAMPRARIFSLRLKVICHMGAAPRSGDVSNFAKV